MFGSLFLFAFLNYYPGVLSQPPWIQPASMSVPLGQTAKLSCTVSGSVNTIYWYQQRPGQAPRYVHYSGGNRGDGIPDRFTASVSGNIGYLTITSLQAEDEADYYCLMWHNSASSWVFGGGTELIVTGQPIVAPTTHILLSPTDGAQVIAMCSTVGFQPSQIQLRWTVDGEDITSGVETTKATKLDGKNRAASYLRMSVAQFKSYDKITCEVTHEGNTYAKSVSTSGTC